MSDNNKSNKLSWQAEHHKEGWEEFFETTKDLSDSEPVQKFDKAVKNG